jgi:2-oxoglutarate ferredoxin oxidoreductase subunit alpha
MNRGGPGLGDIGPAQGDYYQSTRGGGHGDYRTMVLAPGTLQETYDLTIEAFDLAFKYKNPVLVLGDAIIGNMKEPIDMWRPEEFYDESEGWRLDGAKGREKRLIKSLFLEEGALAGQNKHLAEKYERMKSEVRIDLYETDDAELVVCAFGSIGRIAKSAVRKLRAKGEKVGLARPITLYPFPERTLAELAEQGKRFLTIEHNLGQMVDDVRLAVRRHADSDFHPVYPGNLPNPDDLETPILAALGR